MRNVALTVDPQGTVQRKLQQVYAGHPYDNTLFVLEGEAKLEAENFDVGGQEVAYKKANTNAAPADNAIRQQEPNQEGGPNVPVYVEINNVATSFYAEASEADGELSVGNVASGEWLRYSVLIPTAGTFDTQWRIAAFDPAGGQVAIKTKLTLGTGTEVDPCALDGSGGLDITANTGNWRTFQTFPGAKFTVAEAGTAVLTVCLTQVQGFQLNWVAFTQTTFTEVTTDAAVPEDTAAGGAATDTTTTTTCAAVGASCNALPCCRGNCNTNAVCEATTAAAVAKAAKSAAPPSARAAGAAALALAATVAAALHL
ncbi:hypothetical protein JKP88DRAFT_276355 [Tribonema minus]|uniref:CBM6 domain-containing protein n=1 Tax=Tribonema minus TaxID=303371 RepID=A0A835Z3K2_9STRA|nr:hypothetical protein JKP88DRAFT_276355 [Tribonema minus]